MLRLVCVICIVFLFLNNYCLPLRLEAQSTEDIEIATEHNVDRLQLASDANDDSPALDNTDNSVREQAVETGLLPIKCEVPDVQIVVNGDSVGMTPLSEPLTVPIGPIRVMFKRNGYIDNTNTVTITKDSKRPLTCEMEFEKPLNMRYVAILVVNISESGAEVRVDGKEFPLTGVLPSGRHILEVKLKGFKTWRRIVALMTHHKHTIAVRMTPEHDYYTSYVENGKLQRLWSYIIGAVGIAAAGSAIGVAFWNHSRYHQWREAEEQLDKDFQVLPPYPSELVERQRENDRLLDSIHTVDAITVGTALGGSALFITGLVLLLSVDDPDKYDDQTNGYLIDIGRDRGLLCWRTVW